MTTPVMTQHARSRCVEMGISTKVAKRIVQQAELVYPGDPRHDHGEPSWIAQWSGEPDYAVAFCQTAAGPVVLTVLFRRDEQYDAFRKIA